MCLLAIAARHFTETVISQRPVTQQQLMKMSTFGITKSSWVSFFPQMWKPLYNLLTFNKLEFWNYSPWLYQANLTAFYDLSASTVADNIFWKKQQKTSGSYAVFELYFTKSI